jgi:hypothetical protein
MSCKRIAVGAKNLGTCREVSAVSGSAMPPDRPYESQTGSDCRMQGENQYQAKRTAPACKLHAGAAYETQDDLKSV